MEEIKKILIDLTNITGFDHSSTALEAFAQAEEKLKVFNNLAVSKERSRIVENVIEDVKKKHSYQECWEEGDCDCDYLYNYNDIINLINTK